MTRRKSPDVCVPEGSVLKPFDKTVDNSVWPTFLLRDAVVYRPDGVTPANVLLVNTDGPFVVRGRLEVEDDSEELQSLVRPDVRSGYIQIDRSISYSLGCDENLTPLIWVSGDAGWFEIEPHPVYAPIYRDMCSVALLYHQLLESYSAATSRLPTKGERAKVRRTLSIKSILFEYAVAMGNGTTYDETVDMCLRLGPPLLAHFSIVEDYPWTSTSFYMWLTKELKDRDHSGQRPSTGASVSVTKSHSPPVASPAVATPPPTVPSQQLPIRAPPKTEADAQKPAARSGTETPAPVPRQAVLELEDAYSPLPGTPLAGTPVVPIPSATSGPEWDDFRRQLFLIVLAAVRDIGQSYATRRDRPISHLTQSDVHSKLYNYFRLRKYVMSKALSAFFRAELEPALGAAWQTSGYVKWLHSADAETLQPSSPELFLRSLPLQLIRRTPTNTHPQRTASETEAETHGAAKAPSTTGAAQDGSVRATAGKRAVLRLPGSMSRKRPFAESSLDTDTTDSEHTRKMPRRNEDGRFVVHLDDDDDDDIGGSGSVDGKRDNDNSNDYGASTAMAVDLAGVDSGEDDEDDEDDDDTTLVVRAVPLLQPLRPTGPNRTWCCPEPGCSFFVRSAVPAPDSDASDDDGGGDGNEEYEDDGDNDDDDDDDGDGKDTPPNGPAAAAKRARAQIRAHLRGHEEQTLDRMGLAISEGSRGQVSVDHLLEKIRSLAEASQPRSLPAQSPIVRQFLV